MFNYIDVILILILIWFTVSGYMHGLIRALGSILSFVLAMMVGGFVTSFMIRHFGLNPFAPGNMILLIICFIGVAVFVGFVVGVIVNILEGARKFVPFSKTINSLLGMALGFCEGILFISAVFIFADAYAHAGKVRNAILGSLSADWFSGLSHLLSHIFPTVTILS